MVLMNDVSERWARWESNNSGKYAYQYFINMVHSYVRIYTEYLGGREHKADRTDIIKRRCIAQQITMNDIMKEDDMC